jgi:hypothetical protein
MLIISCKYIIIESINLRIKLKKTIFALKFKNYLVLNN